MKDFFSPAAHENIYMTLRYFTDAEVWCIYKNKKHPGFSFLKEILLHHFSASYCIHTQHWIYVFDEEMEYVCFVYKDM